MAVKTVNLEKYWLERGKTYINEHPRHAPYVVKITNRLLEILDKLQFSSVCEVGCAYGRLIKILLDRYPHITATGIDFSPDQLKYAETYVNNPRVNFIHANFQTYQPSQQYDLVITFSCLMHNPPEVVEALIHKMLKMATKYIINVEWYSPIEEVGFEGVDFAHNYEAIYRKFGYTTIRQLIPRYQWYSFGRVKWQFKEKPEKGIWLVKK